MRRIRLKRDYEFIDKTFPVETILVRATPYEQEMFFKSRKMFLSLSNPDFCIAWAGGIMRLFMEWEEVK